MDLKPQEPAEGITKTAQYPGYESYQVPCICGNPDDTIEFTVENDDCEVTVSTYTLQRTRSGTGCARRSNAPSGGRSPSP